MRFRECSILVLLATVLVLLPMRAIAQSAATQPVGGQGVKAPKPVGVFGIVLGVDRSGLLTIVDREGSTKQIAMTGETAYLAGKAESTRDEVVRAGMTVKVYLSADGSVAQAVSARGPAVELGANQLRAFMQATEEEWAVLAPRIERVRELQRAVDGRSGNVKPTKPAAADPNQPPPAPTARSVMRTMLADFWESPGTSRTLLSDLNTLRQLRAKAKADLAAARKELQEIVTPKQEVLLVLQGVLE